MSPDTPHPLTHFDAQGQAHMVDVSAKAETHRVARATGRIRMLPATFQLIAQGQAKKGDVIGVARISSAWRSSRWRISSRSSALSLSATLDLLKASQVTVYAIGLLENAGSARAELQMTLRQLVDTYNRNPKDTIAHDEVARVIRVLEEALRRVPA